MIGIFGKKKISENKVANVFVNSMLAMAEEGFPAVAASLNDDPGFVRPPLVDGSDYGRFLMIIVAGNLSRIPEFFESGPDKRIVELCIEKLACLHDMDKLEFAKLIACYKKYLSQVNHPSKNLQLGMAKALFFKYELNDFQEPYFRDVKNPNPLIIKHIKELIQHFEYDWANFLDRYKVV